MPKKGKISEGKEAAKISRRDFLKTGGMAIAAGSALSSLSSLAGGGAEESGSPVAERVSKKSWKKPNLLFIITDQERFPRHWPEGWAEENLPNRKRLSDRGLTFSRAFCASSMCTPSRASLFTGRYPSEHKVSQTLRYGTGPAAVSQPTLQPGTYNIANLLKDCGYNVQYRGKWHISKDPSGTLEARSPKDLAQYGFLGWLPPEGGTDQNPSVFGGGTTDYDSLYADQTCDFLNEVKADSGKPFALFVCLINPHDIMSYPGVPVEDGGSGGWNSKSYSDIEPYKDTYNYAGVDLDAPPLDRIGLPANMPAEQYKPAAQGESTEFWASVIGEIEDGQQQMEYLRFYAHLHIESDRQIGRILDALESRPKLYKNTIVFRLSDHGEMGLSHGGMRQKAYSAYEETINVPLVVSNPRLFPGPATTGALASLVDLMPTVAAIAEHPDPAGLQMRGTDLTPVIREAIGRTGDIPAAVQDSVLFASDENLGSLKKRSDGTTPYVREPSRVRCLRESKWKIVMYYDCADPSRRVYELYDLESDPLETNNLGDPGNSGSYDHQKLSEMIARLEEKMAQTNTVPVASP